MKCIKYLTVLFFILASNGLFAQFFGQSSNQQLINETVENGFLILNQTYQLCDTTVSPYQYYGRNNENYFGNCYSIGIKTSQGYIFTDKVLYPWRYDPNFEEYKNHAKYKPVIIETTCRNLSDSVFQKSSFNLQKTYFQYDSTIFKTDSLFPDDGFNLDTLNNSKEGWLILVTSNKSLSQNDSASIQLITYRNSLKFEPQKRKYKIKKPAVQNILGGIYVNPVVVGIGQIRFDLAGIVQNIDDEWFVFSLIPETVLSPASSENQLTPVEILEETENPNNEQNNNNKNNNKKNERN